MRRWITRILIGLAALIVLVVIIVQIILWTNIPKNLVVSQIEQELGLRITTRQLTTGWLGRTTLTDVAIGLPLSDESFLAVKTLKVRHTSLVGMIVKRALSITSIEIDKPDIIVRQDAAGKWNLLEVADLLARVGGEKTGQQSQSQGIPKLPTVSLLEGTVHVTNNRNQSLTLAPLNVQGSSQDALVWKYDVRIADSVRLIGKLAPGGDWRHEITLTAHNLDPLLGNWGIRTYGLDVAALWQGQYSNGNVTGRLALDHCIAKALPAAGNVGVAGAVDVSVAGDAVTLKPQQIQIKTTNATLPDITMAAGALVQDSNGFRVQALQVAGLGGLGVVDASFDPRTSTGDLIARWSGLALPDKINHSGSLTASLRMPFTGHPSIKVDLLTQGSTASGSWDARLILAGQGTSWQSIDWTLTSPTLAYKGTHSVQLSQLVGHINQRWPKIELTDLTLPARPHLACSGAINLATRDWFFWLDGGANTSAQNEVVPIAFTVNSWGNAQRYTLAEFDLQVAEAYLWAGGFYDRQLPNPVNLDMYLTHSAPPGIRSPIQGRCLGNFHLSGTLFHEPGAHWYPDLKITGELKSNDLVIFDRPVGDISMGIQGGVQTINDSVRTQLSSTELTFFRGKWRLKAQYPTSSSGVELKLTAQNLPLEELAGFARVNDISGQLTEASWTIQIPTTDVNHLQMESSYTVDHIDLQGLKIDRAEARATLNNGVLKLDPLVARATPDTGRFQASATFDFNNPRHLLTKLQLNQWPQTIPGGAMAAVNADTSLDIDLQHRGAAGSLNASADVVFQKTKLAHAQLAAILNGRVLALRQLRGNVLTGTFDGVANVDLDKPLQASGQIHWYSLDAGTVSDIWPKITGVGGLYSGTITLAPARDPRPLEPVRIDVNVSAENGHFRSVHIGDKGLVAMHAVAYANIDRAVLDHSDIHVADGIVHLWMRVGRGLASQAAQVDFQDLQLDQLAHADPQVTKPMPGLVTGRFSLVGSGADLGKFLGRGHVELTQTDLGNFGPIAFLYAVMNVGGSGNNPSGSGSVDLALEQNALQLNNFRFFNRGIDARGVLNVGPSLWDLSNAPVGGQLVGTVRPLKGTRLPLLADVDQVLGALQSSLTAIDITGTFDHLVPVPSSVAKLGSSIRLLITGDARAQAGEQ